jgi:ketosteroid isomerase-like protein
MFSMNTGETDSIATDELRALLARDAARELLLAYVDRVDAGQVDDALQLFAPDAVLRGPDHHDYVGHAAIAEFFQACAVSMMTHLPSARLRHHLSSIRVTLDESESGHAADTVAYFLAVTAAGPDHWGRYRDRLVWLDGGWRLAHRKLDIEGCTPDGWYGRHLAAAAQVGR